MAKIIDYRIVISAHATENELRAASFLRDNIRLVTGKTLPLVRDTEPPVPYEIVVGETTREALDSFTVTRARDPLAGASWEYIMKSVGTRFYLTGLGIPPAVEAPYTSAYRTLDDGKIGISSNLIHQKTMENLKILGKSLYRQIFAPRIRIAVAMQQKISPRYHTSLTHGVTQSRHQHGMSPFSNSARRNRNGTTA